MGVEGKVPQGSPPGRMLELPNAEGLCVRGEWVWCTSESRLAGEQRKEKGKARVLPLFKVTQLKESRLN